MGWTGFNTPCFRGAPLRVLPILPRVLRTPVLSGGCLKLGKVEKHACKEQETSQFRQHVSSCAKRVSSFARLLGVQSHSQPRVKGPPWGRCGRVLTGTPLRCACGAARSTGRRPHPEAPPSPAPLQCRWSRICRRENLGGLAPHGTFWAPSGCFVGFMRHDFVYIPGQLQAKIAKTGLELLILEPAPPKC